MHRPHEQKDIATIQSLPQFKLSESSKSEMLERLRSEERHQFASRPRRARRAIVGPLASTVAGVAAVGIAAVTVMSTAHGGLTRFTSGAGSEPASGISFPFQPMLPSNLDSKYQLIRTLGTEVMGGKRMHHIVYDAHYGQKGAKVEAFAIHEEQGDAVTGGLEGDLSQEVPVSGVKWDKKIDLGGQPGYASHMYGTWKVGFVRNHVAYILSSPKMSEQQLESIAKQVDTPAKVSLLHTMVFPKYDDAVKAITFKPALPQLSANYTLVRSWADITQTASARTDALVLTYHYNRSDATWFDLIESSSPKTTAAGSHDKLVKTISLNGVPAHVYTSGVKMTEVAWQGPSNLYFELRGELDESTLTKVASSLIP